MIFVEPYGGLCNRMRCISSAYRFARDNKTELTVLWCALDELNCDFNSLFNMKKEVKCRVINIPYADEKHYKRIGIRIKRKSLKAKCQAIYIDLESADELKYEDNIYIRSCSLWYEENESDRYNMFILNSEIQKRVNDFYNNNGENLIGVHIRRTDNTVSIDNSPTELFFEKIEEVREGYPGSKIYIASDDVKEIEKATEYFGKENVIYQEKIDRSRNTKKGILDAATELYILANSKAIVGSYYSSFTDLAADIKGIDKYIARV